MNALERTLIEKAGYDNGWEIVVESVPEQVVLASALHRANATIREDSGRGRWLMSLPAGSLRAELSKAEADYYAGEDQFRVSNDRELGHLLRHAARLARSLPNQPEVRYLATVEKELAATITNTEVERLVRQRVGQDIYRESLMDYWGGACAVTGIAIPALLRASHAIPWSECQSDADRLIRSICSLANLASFGGEAGSTRMECRSQRVLLADPWGKGTKPPLGRRGMMGVEWVESMDCVGWFVPLRAI
ncbi:MAG TPA: HNH endonuclease signature motif containing protein [Terrimicrobiaceae bacterium]|nr:HNH endonuclease signature motif containing protein [Terrimicrobiaceae bacterium]